jgi:hypothetical protein
MSFEQMQASLKMAWAYAPFPWLLAILILLAFAWLWLEYQLTRMGRATPGVRRPWPLLPEISTVFIYVIIWSKRLLIVWLILFLALAGVLFATSEFPDFPPAVTENVLKIGELWHNGYVFIMDHLPGPLAERLAQQSFEKGDIMNLTELSERSGSPVATPIATVTPTAVPSPTPFAISHQPGRYTLER